jgi:hypothetical protein
MRFGGLPGDADHRRPQRTMLSDASRWPAPRPVSAPWSLWCSAAPNAGWKGRGLWTSSGDRVPWLQEGGKGRRRGVDGRALRRLARHRWPQPARNRRVGAAAAQWAHHGGRCRMMGWTRCWFATPLTSPVAIRSRRGRLQVNRQNAQSNRAVAKSGHCAGTLSFLLCRHYPFSE